MSQKYWLKDVSRLCEKVSILHITITNGIWHWVYNWSELHNRYKDVHLNVILFNLIWNFACPTVIIRSCKFNGTLENTQHLGLQLIFLITREIIIKLIQWYPGKEQTPLTRRDIRAILGQHCCNVSSLLGNCQFFLVQKSWWVNQIY